MAILDRQRLLRSRASWNSEDQFLVRCLTIRGVGLWAGGLLGLDESQAKAYAHELVMGTLEPGEPDFLLKIQNDFQARGIEVSDHRIIASVNHQREDAEREIKQRFWKQANASNVIWERRRRQRNTPAPVVIPTVLQNWIKRHGHHA